MILQEENACSQDLNHLGLVAAVISRLKLVEKVDARLKVSKESGAKVSMGQRVAAMILNGLGFTDDRLYLFPEFLENKPVERLLGPGLRAADFNDDALGRCLDAISDYGVTPLFTEIAFEIGLAEKQLGRSAHHDTTSLTVFGEYEEAQTSVGRELKEEGTDFKITYGHSKDHRPDLKQMVLNLATTGAGFPIWMEPHSGNASDKKVLEAGASRMQAFCKQLKEAPSFLYVGDSAFYERCVKEKVDFKWLSRVPERLKEATKWIEMPDESFTWSHLEGGYRVTPLLGAQYGSVAQRWMMVYSEQAFVRENKTLDKQIQKESEAYSKVLWHLSKQVFKCAHDAEAAGLKAIKALRYHNVTWSIETLEKHQGRGRPKQGEAPKMIQSFRLTGVLKQDAVRIELIQRHKGRFILASNELSQTELADIDFLPEYKRQYKTEQGFAFIKSGTFQVSSIFLKKPSRIAALMMVMTLCLMVYRFAQSHLWQALEQNKDTIPNQIKKPTKTPSMAWVFRLFQGIQLWVITEHENHHEWVVNLKSVTRRIIAYFGPVAEKIYANSG